MNDSLWSYEDAEEQDCHHGLGQGHVRDGVLSQAASMPHFTDPVSAAKIRDLQSRHLGGVVYKP